MRVIIKGQGRGSVKRFDYQLGDVVRMKKKHPCGSDLWRVMRVGADIRLECQGCSRQILLARPQVDKSARGIVQREPTAQQTANRKEDGCK